MTRLLLGRLALAIPLVLGIATLLFFVINLAPGDPTQLMINPSMRAEVVAQMRANFGLDQPLPVRYVKWLTALVRGDLGYSYSYNQPVSQVIAQILPNTLLLSGAALAVAFVVGVHPLVGLYAAFIVGLITAVIHR